MKFGIFYELQLPRPWKPDSGLTLDRKRSPAIDKPAIS